MKEKAKFYIAFFILTVFMLLLIFGESIINHLIK